MLAFCPLRISTSTRLFPFLESREGTRLHESMLMMYQIVSISRECSCWQDSWGEESELVMLVEENIEPVVALHGVGCGISIHRFQRSRISDLLMVEFGSLLQDFAVFRGGKDCVGRPN